MFWPKDRVNRSLILGVIILYFLFLKRFGRSGMGMLLNKPWKLIQLKRASRQKTSYHIHLVITAMTLLFCQRLLGKNLYVLLFCWLKSQLANWFLTKRRGTEKYCFFGRCHFISPFWMRSGRSGMGMLLNKPWKLIQLKSLW